MKHYNKIEINPEIMCGKPVIKGTRVTVELILRKLSEGLRRLGDRQEFEFIIRQSAIKSISP